MDLSRLILRFGITLAGALVGAYAGVSLAQSDTGGSSTSTKTLGDQVNVSASSQAGNGVREGLWGGTGIRMQVSKTGAEIEYDCARGTISEPLKLDAHQRFQVKGNHLRDRPGPIRLGERRAAEPASYSGTVDQQTMRLDVILSASSERIGSFTLTHGREGRLRKCL